MYAFTSKFTVIFICISYATAVEKINNDIVNKNVERTIDLTSQLVKIKATITLENTGKEAVKNFLLANDPKENDHITYIGVKDASKTDLRVNKIEVDGHKDKSFHSVILRQNLEPGQTTTLTLEKVLIKSLVPYPSSITQKEKQLVRYFGNHYFFSPYVTLKQVTEVVTGSKNVESYTKLKPVEQSDNIKYGPYSSIESFTKDEMIVHFENNSPFLTVTRLERLIEISHWGNIAVEEQIEIRHTGAKLKGPFSRYDYQRDMTTAQHSIKSYTTILPASAHNIYYRDSNGNISTSTIRPQKDWTELELRPRFPLFGGWQSSYVLGYSVPSYQYLYKTETGEYVLKIRIFDHIFDDMVVEELETRVVLPIGVSNIKLITPYNIERLPNEVTHKYLDNIGRTVIKLRKRNLVEQQIQDLEIHYNWQPAFLLHEPVLISLALFLLFIIVIIYVRLDFSLNKPDHSKKD